MEYVKRFLQAHAAPMFGVLFAVAVMAITIACYLAFLRQDSNEQVQAPTIAYQYDNHAFFPLNSANPTNTAKQVGSASMTPSDVRDVSVRIENVKQEKPERTFYSDSQEEADATAAFVSKQENPKAVVVKEEQPPKETDKAQIYTSNYYSVDMNRKHDIKAGVAGVDGDAYATVSYRNRQVEYTGFYSPVSKKWGAGISYTIAKW